MFACDKCSTFFKYKQDLDIHLENFCDYFANVSFVQYPSTSDSRNNESNCDRALNLSQLKDIYVEVYI